MFIASVRLSVCLSVCLSKFGRLKTKFDDDAERTRKTKFGPTFYVFYIYSVCLKPKF